tara:strand:- start:2271 stop:2555 length:285 start_codon:yes stop_codon:yes gene_type:complete
MEQAEFNKLDKESKVEMVKESQDERSEERSQQDERPEFDLSALVNELKEVRRPVDAVPTYTPKNFLQQFVLYESGATRRLYVYMNGGWYYETLT